MTRLPITILFTLILLAYVALMLPIGLIAVPIALILGTERTEE